MLKRPNRFFYALASLEDPLVTNSRTHSLILKPPHFSSFLFGLTGIPYDQAPSNHWFIFHSFKYFSHILSNIQFLNILKLSIWLEDWIMNTWMHTSKSWGGSVLSMYGQTALNLSYVYISEDLHYHFFLHCWNGHWVFFVLIFRQLVIRGNLIWIYQTIYLCVYQINIF